MQTFNVYRRLTHRYVDTCRHLDNHQFLAAVRATPPRLVREAEGYDDGGSYLLHVRAPAGSPNLTQALRDTLSHHGCSHEYDCCGCRSVRASVRKVSARDYVIVQSVSFNY